MSIQLNINSILENNNNNFLHILYKNEIKKKKVGVTRFNMDGSASNHSVSTSNSPMMNRDVQQPFNQGRLSNTIHQLQL